MRPIPDKVERRQWLLTNDSDYKEWLDSIEFVDNNGIPTKPDYDELLPPADEYPILIIWAENGMPIMRTISLN